MDVYSSISHTFFFAWLLEILITRSYRVASFFLLTYKVSDSFFIKTVVFSILILPSHQWLLSRKCIYFPICVFFLYNNILYIYIIFNHMLFSFSHKSKGMSSWFMLNSFIFLKIMLHFLSAKHPSVIKTDKQNVLYWNRANSKQQTIIL